MSFKRCSKCGFSRFIRMFLKFRDNGTITLAMRKDFRAILIEADFMEAIFNRIELELGLPIRHIVFEAQRNASRDTIDSNIRGIFKIAKVGSLKKMAVPVFCQVAVWSGMGYAKAVKYKPGKYGEAIIRNPFSIQLMGAVIVGAFECIEKKPFSYEMVDYGAESIITIHPDKEKPEISERLQYENPVTKSGNRKYARCKKCKAPTMLSDLDWKDEDGIVYDAKREVRMAFIDGYTANAVLRELANELGDEVYPLVIDAQRLFSRKNLDKEYHLYLQRFGDIDKEMFTLSVLETVALRGQGNPINHSYGDDRLAVSVENPFNPYLLAGHLLALFEICTEKKGQVTWSFADEATINFEMFPK